MIDAITRRNRGYGLCVVSLLLISAAQIALKIGSQHLDMVTVNTDWAATATSAITSGAAFWLAAGIGAYAVSMLVWVAVLRYLPLSVAYPLLSLSYVLVYATAHAVPDLAEPMNLRRTAGLLLVLTGVWLVTGSGLTPNADIGKS